MAGRVLACPGHPRLRCIGLRSWMPGTRACPGLDPGPGMTSQEVSRLVLVILIGDGRSRGSDSLWCPTVRLPRQGETENRKSVFRRCERAELAGRRACLLPFLLVGGAQRRGCGCAGHRTGSLKPAAGTRTGVAVGRASGTRKFGSLRPKLHGRHPLLPCRKHARDRLLPDANIA